MKVLQEKGGPDFAKASPGKEARKIAEVNNLMQESDREVLEQIAKEVLSENKEAPINYLVGLAMKKSGGRANPEILKEIFEELIK